MFGRDWQPAEATVVATRWLSNWTRNTGGAAGGNTTPREYVVDVRPPGGPTFRATFHEPLMHGHYDHPREGQVVNVLFNPKSHKVKLAPEYKVSPGKREQEEDTRFRAIADAEPGADSSADAAEQSQVTHRVIKQGDVTIIGPSQPSVAEQLTKLADLRDRGVLSDAEFESEKAKVLAQG